MKGKLEVIFGCMFAGKSEELIRRLRRAEIANKKAIVFKPKIDDRYDKNDVVSHSGLKAEAHAVNIPADMWAIYLMETQNCEIVAIDEGQFFSSEIFNVIELFINIGLDVIVAGLNQDYRGRGFGVMPEIIAMADETYHLFAVCQKCGGKATKTQRLLNGEPATLDGETILVGGTEQYEARCNNCWRAG